VFVSRFSSYVYAIAVRGYGLDRATAEDIFQEVFSRAYEHIKDVRDDDAARPWLGQVTRRLCVDRLRASARMTPDEREAELGYDDPALVQIEDAASVHDALRTLSDEHRDVLTRFFLQDQSYEKIANEVGVPAGTVASRISRGLGALRRKLEFGPLTFLAIVAASGMLGLAPDSSDPRGAEDAETVDVRHYAFSG
jgi:RNA polymerase sigma-70 factor, ECF subfamily